MTTSGTTAEWMERRFPLQGLYSALEAESLGKPFAFVAYGLGPVNIAVVLMLAWVFDEPGMAAVQLVLLAVYGLVSVLGLRVPRTSLGTLFSLWASLIGAVAGHLILGGYLYSGGYLLWGIFGAVVATLALTRPKVVTLAVSYAVIGVVLGFAEPALRASRPAPDLALSIILIVDLFVVSLAVLVPVGLILVNRLNLEAARNRELMLNILPETIADRLKTEPGMIADRYDGCTILFADLAGFTAHSKGKDPAHLVGELNTIFTRFDALAAQHGAEKIKTIGDGYMAATGLPDPDPAHVAHACDLALAMLDAMAALNAELGTDFALRVGVNTGSAVAGVVGTSKFSYDVWGETVNLASRLESNGAPGVVAVSAGVAQALDGHYRVEALGVKDLKGQGPTEIHRLGPRLPATA
jgi:adenylate cyclase